MKKLNFKILAMVVATTMIIASCGGIDKLKESAKENVKVTVTPKVLVEKGGKVDANIKVKIAPKYFVKGATLEAKAFYVYPGGEVLLGSKTVQGEGVEANNMVVNSKTGGSFEFSGTVDYKKEMRKGTLELRFVAKMKDKELPFNYGEIADGVIATSELVENNPKAILMAHNFERITSEVQKADILYMINQAALRNSELRKDEVKLLKNFIKEVKSNARKEFKGAKISSYASPDGEYDLNEKVSTRREKTAERYMKRELKKAKVNEVKKDDFLVKETTPEDWDGFKELMQASDISDKELILRVLSMYSDPAVREREIKNLAAAFTEVADKILPKLRRSQLFVEANIIGLSDDELMAKVEEDFASLNELEKLYAATLYTDAAKRLDIYTKAHAAHPESIRAINNMAYVQIEMNNLADAKVSLEKAIALNSAHPVVLNNLGVVALKEGDLAKAEELFNKATEAGEAVQYNLGILYIIKGEYNNAVTSFGTPDSFNKALAQYLNEQNDEAIATLGKVKDQNAMVDYLKAVVYANKGEEANVMSNLQSAFEKDAALKAFAKDDLEFRNFFENDKFKGIVM